MPAGTSKTQARGTDRGPAARPAARAERGAILVQVAVMMLALTALSAFIVDAGILWTARRQIQNTADAAAMAAAISLAFDAPGDQARARANALTAVAQNRVWDDVATVGDADITFPACPTGSLGNGTCVRVEAFRNRTSPNPVPTVFAQLVGVLHQGVRATATAQVLFGTGSECVRPIAIPDRWAEFHNPAGPPGWDPTDTFERYAPSGALLPSPDVYTPPVGNGANGTGYSLGPSGFTSGDYGAQARFAPQQFLNQPVGNEQFVPVRITPGASGPADMLTDMTSCAPRVVQPGDVLEVEPADAYTPTFHGVSTLMSQDPAAFWDHRMNDRRGGVSGGCMSTGACTVSPRIVPIVAFDPDRWNAQPPGPQSAVVTRLVGAFIEGYEAPYVRARLMGYPAAPSTSMTADPQSSFVISVALVR